MFSLQSVVRLSLSSSLGLALLLLLSFIYSSPLQSQTLQLVIHRQLERTPDGYTRAGRANPRQTITLSIGLHSTNMTGLKTRLYEVSTPNSPLYGQHLTKKEADDHVRPHPNATNTLNQWLVMNGLAPKTSSSTGHHISLEVTIQQAEIMLNTVFYVYDHTSSNQSIVRTDQYSVPEVMNDTIRYIHPTTHFPPAPNTSLRPPRISIVPSNKITYINRRDVCDPVVVECILPLYGIPSDMGVPRTTNGAAVLAFNGDGALGQDIANFIKQSRPDFHLSDIQADVLSIDEGDFPQSGNTDSTAAMNAQMMLGIMPLTQTRFITGGDLGMGILDAINYVLGLDDIPRVISMGYITLEAGFPSELAHMICETIAVYGSVGGTFVAPTAFSSGNEDTNCADFDAVFPASCPFALSVGGTNISTGTERGTTFSSGGFSDLFPREKYQSDTVDAYLKHIGGLNAGSYNSTGRAYPDITLVGTDVRIQAQGSDSVVSGTPLSVAITAAMISGFNDMRTHQGQSTLGFINPLLYSNMDAFSDITESVSPGGCGMNNFPVSSGWDALTGLGSPIFSTLVDRI